MAIIDKNTELLELVSAYLRPRGYKVSIFSNIEDVIFGLLKEINNWDLVLIDIKSNDRSVINLIAEIKKNYINLPIINISGCDLESRTNMADFLKNEKGQPIIKPIDFQKIVRLIEKRVGLSEQADDSLFLKINGETRQEIPTHFSDIVAKSEIFLETIRYAEKAANSKANVLVMGESGTGKELIARFIHLNSPHRKGPFIAINCSAIPENLLESELFGHSKGAFTGALEKKTGLFEEAQDGTLFLDEIGDLGLPLQAKILRVLQERTVRKVGENKHKTINCRIISATHKNLAAAVVGKLFREDLYFRLNVIPISIPPLRDRKDDIKSLSQFFLKKFSVKNKLKTLFFSKDAEDFLISNLWRGNVRELENSIERAVVLSTGNEIKVENLLPSVTNLLPHKEQENFENKENVFILNHESILPKLEEVIVRYVEFAVRRNNGAKDSTAKELNIDRKTLYKKVKKFNEQNLV